MLQGIEKEEMLASTPDSLLRERTSESEGYAHSPDLPLTGDAPSLTSMGGDLTGSMLLVH